MYQARDMRIGLIGPGEIADTHLIPALGLLPGATFWSVLGRDEARTRDFAMKHQAQAPRSVYTDLLSFLSDPDLDAVIIASPDALHAQQAIAAARAGKHVFVEKPMTTSVRDAEAMLLACQQADVRLAVGYHLRWHAGHRALVEQIRQGAIGVPRHMRVQWTSLAADASNWRASSDTGRWWSLGALGTHCIDLVRWFMLPMCGDMVEVNSCISDAHFATTRDETAVISFRFASGATAEVLCSMAFVSPRTIEVYGSKGSAKCSMTLSWRGEGQIVLNETELVYQPQNPYVAELADFVAAVVDRREPQVNGREGLENVKLLSQMF